MKQTTEEAATYAATLYAKLLGADKLQRLYEHDVRSRGPLAAIDWYVAGRA